METIKKRFEHWENLKILVVDDDYILRNHLVNILKNASNAIIYTAENGVQAIETLKNQHIDIVLTDMHMPQVSGIEIIDYIRNDMKSNMLVFLFTIDSSSLEEEESIFGEDLFILKPVSWNILLFKMDIFLKERKLIHFGND